MTIEVKNSVKPINYIDSMKILEERVIDVYNGKKDEFLWILEHPSVYTGGISSDKKDLLNKKIKIIKTNRGGKYTYHGPGQRVVYFVLNLNKRKKDIRKLVSLIESCIIKVLKSYGVESFADKKNVGIWITHNGKVKKIAAIGIRVKKWIAYHGFSINVNNDLSMYDSIIPCGIRDKGIINLKKIGIKKTNNFNKIIMNEFLSIFRQEHL
tara:strand:- start:188 stop:817 length:630 start_codon:yes stop_codon:yes gene_type:complete